MNNSNNASFDPFLARLREMHNQFYLHYDGPPRRLEVAEKEFRLTCLREEVQEYEDATSRVKELDALTDMLVFLVGSFHRHGFPMRSAFEVVMSANMRKQLAGEAHLSKRGFARDLVKPWNWRGPEETLYRLVQFMDEHATMLNQLGES